MSEEFRLTNRRGLQLAAVLHTPPGNGRHPAVLLLHGFTGHKDEGHLVAMGKALESAGIVAVRFDTSGFGESEGTLDDDFRYSHYRDDIVDMLIWLKLQDFVDEQRIGLWGHSMGGQLAALTAAERDDIAAMVIVSAHTDVHGSFDSARSPEGYLDIKSERFGPLRIPDAFFKDRESYDQDYLINEIPQVHCPALVAWGTGDTTVDPKQTKGLYDQLTSPKESLEFAGMDHFYKRDPKLLAEVTAACTDFFRRQLLEYAL